MATHRLVLAAVLALVMASAACTNDAPSPNAAGSTTLLSTSTTETTTVITTAPEAPPLNTPEQVNEATDAAMTKISVEITLDPEQTACLAARLQSDAVLLAQLGDNPVGSPHWQDVTRLASDCINAVTFSAEFTKNLQLQASGRLTTDQLGCVRQQLSTWDSATIQGLISAGLNPGTTNPDSPAIKLLALLTQCGIDPAAVPPAISSN